MVDFKARVVCSQESKHSLFVVTKMLKTNKNMSVKDEIQLNKQAGLKHANKTNRIQD